MCINFNIYSYIQLVKKISNRGRFSDLGATLNCGLIFLDSSFLLPTKTPLNKRVGRLYWIIYEGNNRVRSRSLYFMLHVMLCHIYYSPRPSTPADRPDLDTLQRCSKFLNRLQLACDSAHTRSYSLTATAFSELCLRPAVWQIWQETLLTLRENTGPWATNKNQRYITKIIQEMYCWKENKGERIWTG